MSERDEAIPFFSSGVGGSSLPQTAQPSSKDEQDFSTLQAIHKTLAEKLFELNKDFNAFAILQADSPEEAAKRLLHDVEVKQSVYDILYPLMQDIEGTLEQINANHRSK